MFYGKYNRTTNEYTPYYGFDISLLNALGDYFNFKWKIDYSFNMWGYKFPNNSWNGLIGKVASKVRSFETQENYKNFLSLICLN